MTIAALIAKLSAMPQDEQVYAWVDDKGAYRIEHVSFDATLGVIMEPKRETEADNSAMLDAEALIYLPIIPSNEQ